MTKGLKQDSAKSPWDLFPWGAAQAVVDVLEHGRRKYSADNWKSVSEPNRRYFAAMIRHLVAWRRGEKNDPESGLSHLAHAGACLLFLLELEVGLGPTSAELDGGLAVWDEKEMEKYGFEVHDRGRRYVRDTKNDKLLGIANDVGVVDWQKLREEIQADGRVPSAVIAASRAAWDTSAIVDVLAPPSPDEAAREVAQAREDAADYRVSPVKADVARQTWNEAEMLEHGFEPFNWERGIVRDIKTGVFLCVLGAPEPVDFKKVREDWNEKRKELKT